MVVDDDRRIAADQGGIPLDDLDRLLARQLVKAVVAMEFETAFADAIARSWRSVDSSPSRPGRYRTASCRRSAVRSPRGSSGRGRGEGRDHHEASIRLAWPLEILLARWMPSETQFLGDGLDELHGVFAVLAGWRASWRPGMSSASTTRSSCVNWTMNESHCDRIVNWGFSGCQWSSAGTGISCRRRENSLLIASRVGLVDRSPQAALVQRFFPSHRIGSSPACAGVRPRSARPCGGAARRWPARPGRRRCW